MCQALTKKKAKCKNRQEPYCYLHKLSMENKTLKESQKKLEKTVKTKNNKIKKIGYDWLNEMAKNLKEHRRETLEDVIMELRILEREHYLKYWK